MKKPFFTVFIPTYNRAHLVSRAISSVLNQTFTDYELVVRNNASTDNTSQVINKIKNQKIRFIDSKTNIGPRGNFIKGVKAGRGKYFVFLADDDLFDKNTLKIYHHALIRFPTAGALTRPYYWFENNYKIAVRKKQTTPEPNDILVDINSPWKDIFLVLSSLDQLSGLCFKKSLMKTDFGKNIWTSHIFPWLEIFKNHPVIFVKKYILAVYMGDSTTHTNIYQKSPMLGWKNLIETIFKEKKFTKIRQKIISDFIGINFVGLVQIRNYGTFYSYLREVKQLIVFNKLNLINYKFWLYFLITLFTPPQILRIITDKYKSIINTKLINQNIIIKLKT